MSSVFVCLQKFLCPNAPLGVKFSNTEHARIHTHTHVHVPYPSRHAGSLLSYHPPRLQGDELPVMVHFLQMDF